MLKSTAAPLFLAALVLAPLAGCWTTQDNTTHDIFGTHTQAVSGTPDQVIAAAREVVRDMGFTEVTSNATKTEGRLVATTPAEKTVEINAQSAGERVTDLSVRVGTGDRDLSYKIIEQVRSRL